MLTNNVLTAQTASRLESLRGVAAMVVAFYHCLYVFSTSASSAPWLEPLMIIFNGKAAVSVFFVLSGLVLGLSLRRSSQPMMLNCTGYLIRRFFRIYPAFLVTEGIAIALVPICRHLPLTDSPWSNEYFSHPVTLRTVIENLTFLTHTFDAITWTLRAEMICSCLLPLFYFGGKVLPAFPWLMLPVLMAVSRHYTDVVSVGVSQAFLVGYLIPQTLPWWKPIARSNAALFVACLTGVAMLTLPRVAGQFPYSTITLCDSIGAALLIGAIIHGGPWAIFSLLDWTPVKTVGRISYSYYLAHPLVLFPLVYLTLTPVEHLTGFRFPVLCAIGYWIVTSAIALPLAWLSFRWIESPAITFSKSLVPRQRREENAYAGATGIATPP